MEVINILADGTEVDDISTVDIPTDNLIYDVCAEIATRGEQMSQSTYLLGLPTEAQHSMPTECSL